jgi:membrane protein implicated in regulation of membrane protease activity
MIRTLMLVIVALMVVSILSILVIKPFVQGSKDAQPPKTIQQPEPQKSSSD